MSARKTRSSTATERVKTVAVAAPGTATRAELPLRAGPAGFASLEDVSPGWSEMRVVFGVQDVAPMQVSRTKTWRKPLFDVELDGCCGGGFCGGVRVRIAMLCGLASRRGKR